MYRTESRERAFRTPGTPKAQVSVEFLSLVSFMVILFLVYMPFFWMQQLDIQTEKEYLMGEKMVISVKKEIDTAVMFGPGYRRNFTLPDQIGPYDYVILIQDKTLKLNWKDRATEENLIAHSIVGNVQPGPNTIRNEDDVIYINS